MALRDIDLTGFAPATLRDQPAPILQWVPVDQIVVDTLYQRDLGVANRRAIQRIADSFDWMKFSPVLLAPTDGGRFAVIDGQHRVHAAALCAIATVPAQIVMATTAQQAAAFAGVNAEVIRITSHQVYRAALAAHEPWAERCHDVVDAAGCTLMTYNPSAKDRKPRAMYQVGTIRRMIVQLGMADDLKKVLGAIVAYDTTGRVPLYTDYVLRPMVEAIYGCAELAGMDVLAFMRSLDPFKVLNVADTLRAQGKKATNMQVMRAAMLRFHGGAA